VVFKRRDRRSVLRITVDFLYPRGGWRRTFHYIKHRVRRLPDSPERIARGIAAGIFTTFTPLFGFHFILAVIIARIVRGNIVASLMATFFGNPLTYVPIGLVSLQVGHWLLGVEYIESNQRPFLGRFADAWFEVKYNVLATFTDRTADWTEFHAFVDDVFFPFMIGGILPGIVVATLFYYFSVPLIRAYQKRRRGVIKSKFNTIKKKTKINLAKKS